MGNMLAKAEKIESFLKRKVRESRAKCIVVGLSGGVDSSLTAYLAVKALGRKKVIGIMMPERGGSSKNDTDLRDASRLAKKLGIKYRVHTLNPILKSYPFSSQNRYAFGNLKARIRMSILYHYANSLGYLVAGTGNRSELLRGYFTKYGDGGVDILPIGDLYKTEVWEMARALGLPREIVEKAPSAGLWTGQTDEGEMGIRYAQLDSILYLLTEKKYPPARIAKKLKFSRALVKRVVDAVDRGEHKRRMPEICKLR